MTPIGTVPDALRPLRTPGSSRQPSAERLSPGPERPVGGGEHERATTGATAGTFTDPRVL